MRLPAALAKALRTMPVRPMTALVFSVHADDAVFSCGEWIANQVANGERVIVASLCSAAPLWDDPGQAWQLTLNSEHCHACDSLGAVPHFVGFTDGKWNPERNAVADAERLAGFISTIQPSTILIPLGISHPDHLYFADLLMFTPSVRKPFPRLAIYEDLPYRVLYPHETVTKVVALGLQEFESAACSGLLEEKLRACRLYASQWSPPEGDAPRCCSAPERIWWVS